MNYVIKELNIKDLEINPSNARFYNNEFIEDEVGAINAMLSLRDSKISVLANDINKYGLNAHEMVIVKPIEGTKRYLIMDGNRRITAVKLMTLYKERLKNLQLSQYDIGQISNTNYKANQVRCLVTSDDILIDTLLERTHTARKGISRVNWNPQARDNFDKKNGKVAARKTVLDMVLASEYCSELIKSFMKEPGWVSKFARFVDNKTILRTYFGLSFNSEGLLLLHWYEEITIKKLCRMIEDAKAKPAAGFVQNSEDMLKYLASIKPQFLLDVRKLNDPLIAFDPGASRFYVTDYANDYSQFADDRIEPEIPSSLSGNSTSGESAAEIDRDNTHDLERKVNLAGGDGDNSPIRAVEQANSFGQSRRKEVSKLISNEDYLSISNPRVRDLYEELKQLPLDNYVNIASSGLRSLIEFSINEYFDKVLKVTPPQKHIDRFVKVYDRISGNYGHNVIKKKMPAINMDVEHYKNNKENLTHITVLNIMMHNHNYHISANDLRQIYKNMHSFLDLIWIDIGK